ncbi:MAG: hypothetical protein HRU02_15105 [Myxococcales bacterium]|nr:hypothetical protein [Myxococcales bacterium]
MTPQRIAAKFLVEPDPAAAVALEPVIGLFHRFIQEQSLPGLLLDVADYAHVPDGPGVVLIGHDVDYGIDLSDGQAGLLVVRKRFAGQAFGEVLRDTLGRALTAAQAIGQESDLGLRFASDALTLHFFDRLVTPNSDEAFESVRGEVEPVAECLYGAASYEISRVRSEDRRKALSLSIRGSGEIAPPSALIERLSA